MRQFSRFADRGKEIRLLESIFTYSPECWYSCPVRKITYHANKLHSGPNVTQRTAYQYQAMFCLPISLAKYENIMTSTGNASIYINLELRHPFSVKMKIYIKKSWKVQYVELVWCNFSPSAIWIFPICRKFKLSIRTSK